MRTVSYATLLSGVCDRMGWDPDKLDSLEWHAAKRAISQALLEAWEEHDWPSIRRCQLRRFHPDYDTTEAVTAGVFRYFPPSGAYYQALRASTGEDPATLVGTTWETNLDYWADASRTLTADIWEADVAYTQGDVVYDSATFLYYQAHTTPPMGTDPSDTGYWGEVTELVPTLLWEEAGKTPIGDVLSVTHLNPNQHRGARGIPYEESTEGIQLMDSTANEAWVRWKLRAPRFTGDVWSSAVAYDAVSAEDAIGFVPDTTTPGGGGGGGGDLIVVDGVAALELESYSDGKTLPLRYLLTPGDGQGGWFVFDAASTATAGGADVVRPASLSASDPGRWIRSDSL